RFEEHNSVDRQRFPGFTNELRQAMFEEPVRYLIDVARRNRSVLDLPYGNDTFVNRPLARHYGMPEPPRDEWVHVEDARRYGRARDLGGHPVQTGATFPDGTERKGLEGLRAYLREKRQDDFIDNLCRKLFAYALGRGLLPSDRKALDGMRARLAADNYAFGSLV